LFKLLLLFLSVPADWSLFVALSFFQLTFADLISRSPDPWVRPELNMNDATVIKDGRHPLVAEATHEQVVPVSERSARISGGRTASARSSTDVGLCLCYRTMRI